MHQKTWRRGSSLDLYWFWGTLTGPTVYWWNYVTLNLRIPTTDTTSMVAHSSEESGCTENHGPLDLGGDSAWLSMIYHLPHYSHCRSLFSFPLSFSFHSMCKHNKIKIPLISKFHCFVNSSMTGEPQEFFWIFLPNKVFSTISSGMVYSRWSHLSLLYNHGSLNVHLSCGSLRWD